MIEAEPLLELVAPHDHQHRLLPLSAGHATGEALKALNTEIMLRLQEEGIAVFRHDRARRALPARGDQQPPHRRDDLQMLVRETVKLGNAIAAGQAE